MFSSNLSVVGGELVSGEHPSHSFVLIKQNNGETIRVAADYPVSTAPKIRISHTSTGKGDSVVDRHLVQVSQSKIVGVAPQTMTVNFTLTVPRAGDAFDAIDARDLCKFLWNFIGADYANNDPQQPDEQVLTQLSSLLRGES